MNKMLPLLLLLAAGCSGGPLKEIPVFEPPPPEPEAPAPLPPPPLRTNVPDSFVPAPAPELPTLLGAWSSTAALGPGSASVGRIVLVFDADGGLAGAAFGTEGARSFAGFYEDMDGAVRVDLGCGDLRLWVKELEPGSLVLREDDKELRLSRLR